MMQPELKRPLEMQMIQREILRSKSESEFSAAVGLSREWDARKAGREVASDALTKLKGKKPDLFLLFSTIHYEKYGGFKEFLAGVWEILPPGTPLVGGTVAGFINNQGCFTRGASALAISYPRMDVVIGLGKNTKRDPVRAARSCASMIKKGLKESEYSHKFIISVISGTKVMEVPLAGQKNVIISKPLARILKLGLSLSTVLMQKGPGREEEVLEGLTKDLSDYTLTHISTIDDMYLLRNYQFMGAEVLTDAITAIAFSTDMDYCTDYAHGGVPVKEININKHSLNNRLTDEIDGKPAATEFAERMKLPKRFFFEDTAWQKRFPYFPIGFEKNGRILPRAIVMVLNESLFTKTRIESDKACILSMSGRKMSEAVEELLKSEEFVRIEPFFGLIVSCGIRLTAIGDKIYHSRDMLQTYYKEKPFLAVFTAGEGMYTPEKGLYVLEESINISSFGKKT
jgi:hypothetical protein